MKRRKFLLATLLTVPIVSSAKFENDAEGKKGMLIKADDSRFNGELKTGDKSSSLCKVSAVDTGGNLLILDGGENSFNAKGGPPMHIHLYQDEIFYVSKGEYLIQVGEEKFQVKEGDTVFAPRQIPHSFTRLTDQPGKLMTIFQPAGKMEDFFAKLNAFKGMPDRDSFMKLFEEHDMKIVGPPLSVK